MPPIGPQHGLDPRGRIQHVLSLLLGDMEVKHLDIPGVLLLTPRTFADARGLFQEVFQAARYASVGFNAAFVQDNFSRSVGGTLRGLHYQIRQPQGKLVQVLRGRVFDVAVDLRRRSPTFGRWVSHELSEDNHHQLYIPPGCAHGFLVLSDEADVFYKCTDYYSADHERTIRWNDPELNIGWPARGEPVLSEKDKRGVSLAEAECYDGDLPRS